MHPSHHMTWENVTGVQIFRIVVACLSGCSLNSYHDVHLKESDKELGPRTEAHGVSPTLLTRSSAFYLTLNSAWLRFDRRRLVPNNV
jgi:hypothetical protein